MDTANPERSISREVPRSQAVGSPSTQADMSNKPTPPNAAEREQSEQLQSNNRRVSAPIERGSGFLSAMLRRLATFAIALVAVLVSIVTWDLYVTAPWTRDGRIRVQVASVAPEVAGKITALRVVDNQFVHKGDILYQIDPFDFEVSFRTNKAILEQRQADQHVKELQSQRRQHLSDLATTPEEQQVYEGSSIQAKAAVDAAQQQASQADINLQRTQVRSPVNGYVTNLLLREGDYAHTGVSNISIIDTDSFWIDGYFEETKLAQVCVGDRAEAKLMGYALPIVGHVTTVTRGECLQRDNWRPRVTERRSSVHLGAPGPASSSAHRDRRRAARRSARVRNNRNGNDTRCSANRKRNLVRAHQVFRDDESLGRNKRGVIATWLHSGSVLTREPARPRQFSRSQRTCAPHVARRGWHILPAMGRGVVHLASDQLRFGGSNMPTVGNLP